MKFQCDRCGAAIHVGEILCSNCMQQELEDLYCKKRKTTGYSCVSKRYPLYKKFRDEIKNGI